MTTYIQNAPGSKQDFKQYFKQDFKQDFKQELGTFISSLEEAVLLLDKNRIENVFENPTYRNFVAETMFSGFWDRNSLECSLNGVYAKGLRHALSNNNIDMIEYFMNKSGNDITDVVFMAIILSNMNTLLHFLSKKDYKCYNKFLIHAVFRGNKEMIDFFISKGATDWGNCLREAIKVNNLDLVKFFSQKLKHRIDVLANIRNETIGNNEITRYLDEITK